jgi:hypothetical protein
MKKTLIVVMLALIETKLLEKIHIYRVITAQNTNIGTVCTKNVHLKGYIDIARRWQTEMVKDDLGRALARPEFFWATFSKIWNF